MPMLNMRVIQPPHIIDLNRVAGLSYIRVDGAVLEVGAMTRQRDIEFSEVVGRVFPLLQEAMRHIGHRQTRNRGTVGGSLCHLDPSAEIVAVATAVGATVVANSRAGAREINFDDFPRGLMTPAIESNELVSAVRFPIWKPGHGFAFEEFARRHGDFALASAAVLLEMDGQYITRSSLTVGGVDSRPRRLTTKLEGSQASAAAFDEAADGCSGLEAMDDVHVTGEYRRRVARAMVRRALERALARVRKH